MSRRLLDVSIKITSRGWSIPSACYSGLVRCQLGSEAEAEGDRSGERLSYHMLAD